MRAMHLRLFDTFVISHFSFSFVFVAIISYFGELLYVHIQTIPLCRVSCWATPPSATAPPSLPRTPLLLLLRWTSCPGLIRMCNAIIWSKGQIITIPICLSNFLSLYIQLSFTGFLYYFFVSAFIYLCIFLFFYMSYLPVFFLSIYTSLYILSTYQSVVLSIYLDIFLSICFSICLFIQLNIYLYLKHGHRLAVSQARRPPCQLTSTSGTTSRSSRQGFYFY